MPKSKDNDLNSSRLRRDEFIRNLETIVEKWDTLVQKELTGADIYVGSQDALSEMTCRDELNQMQGILLDLNDALPKYYDNFLRLSGIEDAIKPENFSIYTNPGTYLARLSDSVDNIIENISTIQNNPTADTAAAKSTEIAGYLPGFKEMKAEINSRIVEMERFEDLTYVSPDNDPIDSDLGYKLRKLFGGPIAWAAVNPEKVKNIGKATLGFLGLCAVGATIIFGYNSISSNVSENRALKATQSQQAFIAESTQKAQAYSATSTAQAQSAFALATQTALESARRGEIIQYISMLEGAESAAEQARLKGGFWFSDSEMAAITQPAQMLIDLYIANGGNPDQIGSAVESSVAALQDMSKNPDFKKVQAFQFYTTSVYSSNPNAPAEGQYPSDEWLKGIVCGGFLDNRGTYGEPNWGDDLAIVMVRTADEEGLNGLKAAIKEETDGQTDSTLVRRADGYYVLGAAMRDKESTITDWYLIGNYEVPAGMTGNELVDLISKNQCPQGGN